jgi:choline dehydrogenase
MTARFDALVLGGGTAGCVLAARLSENPERTVCLVEAGPDYGPHAEGRWPDDLRDARALAFSHSWETDREDRSQLRARVIGGCSAHNACVVFEGAPVDYDEWGPGWTYAEFRPYLERAREMLRVRRFEADELSPWHAAFVQAAGEDAAVHDVNAVGTTRWNTAFAYLDAARTRANLTILSETLVDRVLLDGNRVAGAATSAGELAAETVVASAGAYGTPGSLLRSGVGPERGLPVGEQLTDHVGVGIGWEPTRDLRRDVAAFEERRPSYMAQATVRARSKQCAPGVCDLFVFPALDPGCEISAAVFAMKPASRGRVSLTSRDPRAPLRIEHGFLADPHDAEVLEEGCEALRELARAHPVARCVATEVRPGPTVAADTHVRQAARGFFHPVGTCAIGSVVDARGRVHGFENLFVADASIMPTIPRANTNLTTVAIAERIAELLEAV